MRTHLCRLLMACGTALIVTTNSSAFAEDISISGVVHAIDDTPINMIKVTLYRDAHELNHAFTAEDGKYAMTVPKGKPITVRFDTHLTLNNSLDWHPSVVANVGATQDVSVDRILLRVGHADSNTYSIDALSGYEFASYWEEMDPSKGYEQSAQRRLAMMKNTSPILQELQQKLQDYFLEQSRVP